MSTCPRCGADNYINTCELCGFEQTRDVLSYYTLSKLNEDDVKFFDTEARLIRNCEKQLKALNSFIKENGTESSGTHLSLRELCEEYLSLTESQPKNEYEGMSANELNDLALEYYNGSGEKEQDFVKAFELFTMAAEKGNAVAMYNLGYLYKNGKGVTQDYERAIEWYKKAAEKGDADAMNKLGYMYYIGEGVTRDYARAFEWYKKAAEKGSISAMDDLAKMYENGVGVARDKQKAEEWQKKAEAARR